MPSAPIRSPNPVRELVFCASSSYCTTARMVEKGTIFYCQKHKMQGEQEEAERVAAELRPGDHVIAKDRHNHGTVLDVEGTMATVRFLNAELGTCTDVRMSTAWLEPA